MKTSKYRDISFLMNQELLINYRSLFNSLAFTLAVKEVLTGLDKLTVEEKITDETALKVSEQQSLLFPLINTCHPDSKALSEVLLNSSIITMPLENGINQVFAYREESLDITSSFLDPYNKDYEVFKDSVEEFYRRTVTVYRLKSWLSDISDGIEQYGVEPYLLPEDYSFDDKEDILEGVDTMTFEELSKELSSCLKIQDDDDDNTSEDKYNLISIKTVIETTLLKKGK